MPFGLSVQSNALASSAHRGFYRAQGRPSGAAPSAPAGLGIPSQPLCASCGREVHIHSALPMRPPPRAGPHRVLIRYGARAASQTKLGHIDRRVRLVAGSPTQCCARMYGQPVAQCINR